MEKAEENVNRRTIYLSSEGDGMNEERELYSYFVNHHDTLHKIALRHEMTVGSNDIIPLTP